MVDEPEMVEQVGARAAAEGVVAVRVLVLPWQQASEAARRGEGGGGRAGGVEPQR